MKPSAVFMSLMLLATAPLRGMYATEAILLVTFVSRSQRGFMTSDIQNRDAELRKFRDEETKIISID
jgi:hypothetical protein